MFDVADALVEIEQQHLVADRLPLVVEDDPLDVAGARGFTHAHGADEQIAFPLRELVTGVEDETARRDRRDIGDVRAGDAILAGIGSDRTAAVVAAFARHWPAIVAAGAQDVHLVAAIGGVFGRPHLIGPRVHGEAEIDAVAHREDFGVCILAAVERVVGRRRAIVVEAQRLAAVVVGFLRAHHRGVGAEGGPADGGVELALIVELQLAVERVDVVGDEDVLAVDDLLAVPLAAVDGVGAEVAARLVVGHVDPAIGLEVRVQDEVHEAGGDAEVRVDFRGAFNRLRIELAIADDAQRAGALDDEDVAVRQEFDGAGRFEAARDDGGAQLALFPRFRVEGAVAEFRGGPGRRAFDF